MSKICIKSVKECLELPIDIPNYQRPYKWSIQNVDDLLGDISDAIEKSKVYADFKYRIGTVIVHKNGQSYDVVDGQQRLVSLTLICKCIDAEYHNKLFDHEFSDKSSQANIHNNFKHIREWFALREGAEQPFKMAFSKCLEVVVIYVDSESEAFQLFDSQNTRGRALDPHDLLKAYHLREMKDNPYEMEYAVTKWEAKDTDEIKILFDEFLFPIWNWSRGQKTTSFTAKEIGTYKGISANSTYTYAQRAFKAMPYFQITEPFIAGGDFFEMVDLYLRLLKNIKAEVKNNPRFSTIQEVVDQRTSAGIKYAVNLFYAALLFYYDKFHNMDEMAVKKIFMWAMMLRVDMEHLGYDSINKYAIGEWTDKYTNCIPMFAMVNSARLHNEIANVQINTKHGDSKLNDERDKLYKVIRKMNGEYE